MLPSGLPGFGGPGGGGVKKEDIGFMPLSFASAAVNGLSFGGIGRPGCDELLRSPDVAAAASQHVSHDVATPWHAAHVEIYVDTADEPSLGHVPDN
eukprot:4306780-Prymnesium_polylepis.1